MSTTKYAHNVSNFESFADILTAISFQIQIESNPLSIFANTAIMISYRSMLIDVVPSSFFLNQQIASSRGFHLYASILASIGCY